jgi:hypothetical protein
MSKYILNIHYLKPASMNLDADFLHIKREQRGRV